jgi:hypothetical protein
MIAFFENVSHFEILEHSKKWFFLGTHFFQVVKPVISFFFLRTVLSKYKFSYYLSFPLTESSAQKCLEFS